MFYFAFSLSIWVLVSFISHPESWPRRLSEFLRGHRLHS